MRKQRQRVAQPRHARHAKYALLLSFIWVP